MFPCTDVQLDPSGLSGVTFRNSAPKQKFTAKKVKKSTTVQKNLTRSERHACKCGQRMLWCHSHRAIPTCKSTPSLESYLLFVKHNHRTLELCLLVQAVTEFTCDFVSLKASRANKLRDW